MNPIASRKFKPKYADELLSIAEGDLSSAKGLLKLREGRDENICYLAEQCIEKCIKAVLCKLDKPIVFTHDLGILLTEIPVEFSPPNVNNLSELSLYASVRRYEEGSFEYTPEDLQNIINLGDQYLMWAKMIKQ